MAYFANGSEGDCLDQQCSLCRYGEQPCPIFEMQLMFNYDQLKDTTGTASNIMDLLIKNDGTCTMFQRFENDFSLKPKVTPLFPEDIPKIKYAEPIQ